MLRNTLVSLTLQPVFYFLENNMPSIVTRWRNGSTAQEISDELKITVKEVLAVLREKRKEWDKVNK